MDRGGGVGKQRSRCVPREAFVHVNIFGRNVCVGLGGGQNFGESGVEWVSQNLAKTLYPYTLRRVSSEDGA